MPHDQTVVEEVEDDDAIYDAVSDDDDAGRGRNNGAELAAQIDMSAGGRRGRARSRRPSRGSVNSRAAKLGRRRRKRKC